MIAAWLATASEPRGLVVACLDGQRGEVFRGRGRDRSGARTVDDARVACSSHRRPAGRARPGVAACATVRTRRDRRRAAPDAIATRFAAARPDAAFVDVAGLAGRGGRAHRRAPSRARRRAARAPAVLRAPTRRRARARERRGLAAPAPDLAALAVRRAADARRSRRRRRPAAPDVHQSLGRRRDSLGAREHRRRASVRACAAATARSSPIAPAGWSSTSCTSTASPSTSSWRRQGAGATAARRACSTTRPAAGATAATLEVRQSNAAARALYEGLGFRVEGVRRDYYQDPREDALILWNRQSGGARSGADPGPRLIASGTVVPSVCAVTRTRYSSKGGGAWHRLSSRRDDVKAVLLQTNEEFRQLVSEHHALDEQIRNLSQSPILTDQQQFEEISLKKKKLALKDRIEAIVRGTGHTGFASWPASSVRPATPAEVACPDGLARVSFSAAASLIVRIDPAASPFVALAALPAVAAAVAGCRRPAWPLLVLPVAIALFFRDPDRIVAGRSATRCCRRPTARVMHAGPSRAGRGAAGRLAAGHDFSVAARRAHQSHAGRRPGHAASTTCRALSRRVPARRAPERALGDLDRSRRQAGRRPPGRRACWPAGSSAGCVRATRSAPGQRIGLMKFGSRMDVFVPVSATVDLREGRQGRARRDGHRAAWPRHA